MRTYLSAFLLLACSSLVLAAEKKNLSQLLDSASKNHPAIGAARAEVDSARAEKSGLLAPFRPQVSLNGYGAVGTGSMIFPGTVDPLNYAVLPRESAGVLNATFMWKLFTFGRERAIAESASFLIRAKQSVLDATALDVSLSVRLAFADALYRREVVQAHHVAHDSALEVLRITQARFDAGKVPEAFVLRAKADAARAEREIAMAEADSASAQAQLWDAAGMEQSSAPELGDWDGSLSAPATMDEAIKLAMSRRQELIAIGSQVSQMKSLASAYDKAGLPELSLMGMNDWAGSLGVSASNTYKAGLVLSFPLGDGGQRRSAAAQSNAMAKKAEAELRGATNHVQSEVATGWAEWSAVSKVLKAAAAELDASVEAYRVALVRYEDGKAILAELTDSRSQLVHARLSVAEGSAYQRKAWSKLTRAIGR